MNSNNAFDRLMAAKALIGQTDTTDVPKVSEGANEWLSRVKASIAEIEATMKVKNGKRPAVAS